MPSNPTSTNTVTTAVAGSAANLPPPTHSASVLNVPSRRLFMCQEERRGAVAEMRRLADLSGRKADAMIARRGRREKARLLSAWRRLHDKRKNRRKTEGEEEEARGNRRGGGRRTSSQKYGSGSSSSSGGSDEESRSGSSSDSGTSSSSGSAGSSRSGAGGSSDGDRSSSFASSLSTKEQLENSGDEASSLSSSALLPRALPVPSAADAAEAGRASFAACFRAETRRAGALGGRKVTGNMASVEIAAEAVHMAMSGGRRKGGVGGAPGFTTQEMRALARFEWHRKTHEAEITRVVRLVEVER